MGCLTRIGCGVVILVGGAVGYWLYGDRLPSVLSRAASGAAETVTDVAVRTSERLDSQEGARIAAEEEARRRTRREARDRALGWVAIDADAPKLRKGVKDPLAPLRQRNGPAYVSLEASQVATVLAPLLAQLPPSVVTADIAFERDQLLLRTSVALRDFTNVNALGGILGKALDGEDTLFIAGPIEPVRPGLAQLRVKELRLKGLDLPPRIIPSLVGSLKRQALRAGAPMDTVGITGDGLPVPLPRGVSDARVVNGALTLYRGTSDAAPPRPR
ncbi:MAG: hypothetical protein IBJ03_03950 [Gemmatimonadaceae bacterium]|nr:hypothetical protein [Gemmatimonadaceae bacterium]